jgi:transposase
MLKKKSVKSQYSLEFKNQVLEVLESSPKSMAQIAREFGVSYPTLNSWKRSNSEKDNLNSKKNSDELKKLQREYDLLKKENEILKKAASFFAKQLD